MSSQLNDEPAGWTSVPRKGRRSRETAAMEAPVAEATRQPKKKKKTATKARGEPAVAVAAKDPAAIDLTTTATNATNHTATTTVTGIAPSQPVFLREASMSTATPLTPNRRTSRSVALHQQEQQSDHHKQQRRQYPPHSVNDNNDDDDCGSQRHRLPNNNGSGSGSSNSTFEDPNDILRRDAGACWETPSRAAKRNKRRKRRRRRRRSGETTPSDIVGVQTPPPSTSSVDDGSIAGGGETHHGNDDTTTNNKTKNSPLILKRSANAKKNAAKRERKKRQKASQKGSKQTTTSVTATIESTKEETTVGSSSSSSFGTEPCPRVAARLFACLCVFRLLNVCLLQSAFDPDEYWQSLEPAYCTVFGDCQGLTWEWTRRAAAVSADEHYRTILSFAHQLWTDSLHGPVRSTLGLLPTLAWYRCLQWTGTDTSWMVARGPLLVAAVTQAAPTDLAVWWMSHSYSCCNSCLDGDHGTSTHRTRRTLPWWALFAHLSSWFAAYTMCRTLANGQETVLVTVAVAVLYPCVVRATTDANDSKKMGRRTMVAFVMGGLAVSIRFTALLAFVPLGLFTSHRMANVNQQIMYLVFKCAVFSLAGIFVAGCVDRAFFGFATIPALGNVYFNLHHANLYGSHPWHWYWTTGLPAVAGILLPFIVAEISHAPLKISSGPRLLWTIVLAYLCTLSFSDHKEFRFILPILPLLCVLTAGRVQQVLQNRRRLLGVWVVANLIAVVYLGTIHQTGPISVNRAIMKRVAQLTPNGNVTVHYLTGGCHSTPLLSHLHSRGIKFHTWHLNCDPTCRADAAPTCESEQFANNPLDFIAQSYCVGLPRRLRKTCYPNPSPDFVVTFSEFADRLEAPLNAMGLHRAESFYHRLTGIRMGERPVEDSMTKGTTTFGRRIRLETIFDEVVLFAKI